MNCWIQFLKRGCPLQSRTSLNHTYIFCLVGNFRLMKRCSSYLFLQSRNSNYPSLYSLFVDLFPFFAAIYRRPLCLNLRLIFLCFSGISEYGAMSGAYICLIFATFILDPLVHLTVLLYLFWIIFVIV